MKNAKFIIHNKTIHYNDWEIFVFISQCLMQGLISNEGTEYCYCITMDCDDHTLVFTSKKTKTGYRFDVYEDKKNTK